MMKKSKLLIVDGENLLHRSYHKFLNFKSTDGRPSGAIYGFFKSLHSNMFRFQVDKVIITFDNGRSKHRTEILPNYKGNRKKIGMDYDSLQSQKKEIRKILKYLGVPVIFDKSFKNQYESDDYIALLTDKHDGDIVILSSDKDFCQLISKRVKIMNPSKDSLVTLHNCKEIMGYSSDECVDYLILAGDSSDNIPGVNGMGEKKTRQFLDQYGSIQNYLTMATSKGGKNPIIEKAYNEWGDLIDLKRFIRKYPIKKIPVKHSKQNLTKVKEKFIEYSITSMLSEEFLTIFKSLKWDKKLLS